MATVTVRGYVSNVSTVSSAAATLVLPAGLVDGDTATVMVTLMAAAGTTVTMTGWTTQAGPVTINNAEVTYVFTKTVAAADSGTTVTATLSGTTGWSMVGLVTDGPFDAIAAATNTTLSGTATIPAYTPVAADCLAVFLVGRKAASTDTTGGTPGTGWTRQVDTQATSSAIGGAHAEAIIDSRQLVGQAGSTQGASTAAWNSTARSAQWVVTIAPRASSTVPGAGTVAATSSSSGAGTTRLAGAAATPAVTALVGAAVGLAVAAGVTGAASGSPGAATSQQSGAGRAAAASTVTGAATLAPAGAGIAASASSSFGGATVLATGAGTTPAATSSIGAAGGSYLAGGQAAAVTAVLTGDGTAIAEGAGLAHALSSVFGTARTFIPPRNVTATVVEHQRTVTAVEHVRTMTVSEHTRTITAADRS